MTRIYIIVAFRNVARQQLQNKQLYNSRCLVLALQTTAVAKQWLRSDHVGTLTRREQLNCNRRMILSRVLSARGNNKRGFSGFNKEVYLNNCRDYTQQI
jgi:hypothetical protein